MSNQKISTVIIFLFSFFNNAVAQQYLNDESNSIRINPAWVSTNEAGDFCWAHDVIADKNGNIYSTGYFRKSIHTGKEVIYPSCPINEECGDTYFLIKRDSSGKFLWIRYAIGNSRPAKIVIDNKGFVYTVGSVYSKALTFTTSDSNTVKLDKPFNYTAGIFICKYDPSGKVIDTHFFSEGKNETPNDMLIDAIGNFYLAGTYNFRLFNKPSEVQRSYLLVKLSPDFKLLWKQQGDTIGTSDIRAIAFMNKDIYAVGSYEKNIKLGDAIVKSDLLYDGNAFIAKFSSAGKYIWSNDSITKAGMGYAQKIVCDKKGNAYIGVNTSYSNAFLCKVNISGKLEWMQSINGKASNNIQKMLIDARDNIYLCGEGYGAVFGTTGPMLLSYKSKGGTDIFLAKYNTQGNLLWLKAGGGKGTDYCKAITLHNNNVYAFGWFGAYMNLGDSALKGNSSYTFWTARFNQKALDYVDKSLIKTPVKDEETPNGIKTNNITCECLQQTEKEKGLPGLMTDLVSYDAFKKFTGWEFAGKENFYDKLFYKGLQVSLNNGGGLYALTGLVYKPIRLMHPAKTFTINITPCATTNIGTELPIKVNYEQNIKKYIPGFDEDSFDRTATAYTNVLLRIAGVDDKDILHKLLFNYMTDDINSFISKINATYGLTITTNAGNEEKLVEDILKGLDSKKIAFADFIVTQFVQTDNLPHPLNEKEELALIDIFSDRIGGFSVETLNRFIYPQVRASIDTKKIGIEIDEKIIRRWDGIKKKPLTDQNGKFIPANILADVPSLGYSTQDGINVTLKDVCFTHSEITGTGILLNFNKATLVTVSNYHEYKLNNINYPLFITDSTFFPGQPMAQAHYEYKYDPLITSFSGLLINDATVQLPGTKKMIPAIGRNIIINNKLISGVLIFQAETLIDSKTFPTAPNIKTGDQPFEVSMQELQQAVQKLGINNYRFVNERGQLKMYFKKIL